METKVLNNRELSQIRRIAQNVDADYQKVCKLEAKQKELQKEIDSLQEGIDEMEAPVIRKTGGFKSTDIFMKVIVPQMTEEGTPKVDKNGRPVKVTKYSLRYPDTIFPSTKESKSVEDEVKEELLQKEAEEAPIAEPVVPEETTNEEPQEFNF